MPLEIKRETKSYRHGGRTVLRLLAEQPLGETAAAAHLRALIRALWDFAESSHLPAAVSALELTAAENAVFGFFPYRYEVKLQESTLGTRLCLTLGATLYRENAIASHQVLSTYWTSDLALQLPPQKIKYE